MVDCGSTHLRRSGYISPWCKGEGGAKCAESECFDKVCEPRASCASFSSRWIKHRFAMKPNYADILCAGVKCEQTDAKTCTAPLAFEGEIQKEKQAREALEKKVDHQIDE